jgi:hypothetical protein
MGAAVLWPLRAAIWVLIVLVASLVATSAWSFTLLDRSPTWNPWLRYAVVVAGTLASLAILTGPKLARMLRPGMIALALAAGLGGPLAYSLATADTAYAGALPSAGPAVAGTSGFGGGPGGAAGRGGFPGGAGIGRTGHTGTGTGAGTGGSGTGTPFGGAPGARTGGGTGAFPGSPPSGSSSKSVLPTGAGAGGTGTGGTSTGAFPAGLGGRTGGAGGVGSLLNGSTPGSAIVKLLEQNASHYTWVAATVGSNSAAGYQLSTDDPVMAIGGFNGTDPAPTLAEFQQFVKEHKIHYFISGGVVSGAGGNATSDASRIATWVADHFTAKTVGGVTVYNLTSASR